MKILNQQKGVALILELLLVAAVAVAGTLVFMNWQQANQKAKEAEVKQEAADNESQQKQTQQSQTSQYLEIKEWGVRFKLTAAYTDMYYEVVDRADGSSAYFSLRSLDAPAPDCAPDKTSQVAIGRYSMAQEVPSNVTSIRTIGNYRYTSAWGQAPCAPEGSASEQTVSNLRRDFASLAESLEATP